MTTKLPKQVKISPDVLGCDLDTEGVLLNLQDEQYYIFNDIGMRMWQLISEFEEVDLILSKLLDEFEAPQDRLEEDLALFIEKLLGAGLVTISQP